jgi:hypothetical protein
MRTFTWRSAFLYSFYLQTMYRHWTKNGQEKGLIILSYTLSYFFPFTAGYSKIFSSLWAQYLLGTLFTVRLVYFARTRIFLNWWKLALYIVILSSVFCLSKYFAYLQMVCNSAYPALPSPPLSSTPPPLSFLHRKYFITRGRGGGIQKMKHKWERRTEI